ncbi:MAG: hypothetical protein GY943_36320 [Chloroflexi bacterium]|nr:hypothetical protein [Chloroflexota bacterium]
MLLLLATFALVVVVRSWRDMKQSPYFFLRQQAAKRLQTYSLASLSLIGLTLLTAAYTLQTPTDNVIRVATISNAKPVSEEIRALVESTAPQTTTTLIEEENEVVQEPISTQDVFILNESNELLTQAILTLPEEFDQVAPVTELNADTNLGSLAFSTKIDDQYEPVDVANIFAEGSYTLFATFEYAQMDNGMVWSWVWRHEGKVVDGGNEVWNYGQDGPGYIYYNPDEGFQFGDYSLEVWVNGELFTQSDLVINTAAVSSGS